MIEWLDHTMKDISLGIFDGPHATPKPSDKGPVFLGIKNITEDGHFDLEKIRHISEEEYPKWTKRVTPQMGDIVFTYEATLNRYAVIPENFKCCLGRRMALIRPDTSKVDTDFLFYYFFTPEWREVVRENTISGSTVDRIPLTYFPEYKVRLPKLNYQREVSGVIHEYTSLIKNNNSRIKILEEIAQAIYTEWFVNFRFPGHEKVTLTNSSTEFGKIPEGWKVGTLSDIVKTVKEPTKAGEALAGRRYVPIDAITSNQITLDHFKSNELAKSSLITFEENDILFGAMRPYFHKVTVAPFAGVTRTTCLVLRPIDTLSYPAMSLFQKETVDFATAHSQGSTIPYVKWNNALENKPVLIPDKNVTDAYDFLVRPMLKEAQNLVKQNQVLRESRDLIIPKLVTGEIEIMT
jgi:type I restriction enzyme S subunit